MIIDGKIIAHSLLEAFREEIRQTKWHLTLGIVVTVHDPVIEKFIEKKKQFAAECGVHMLEVRLERGADNEEVLEKIFHLAHETDGIIVQLPLAPKVRLDDVYRILPITHDVDVLGATAFEQFREGRLPLLPPVTGAMHEILSRHHITLAGKKVVVVGEGRLVGLPGAIWARRMGAVSVDVVNKGTEDVGALTREADVIMLGAGVPGLLQPDMVKEGAVILDAGTSETAGVVKGDADPSCAEKASLFTPSPGGIGPITVAMIFKNLLALKGLREEHGR